MEKQQDSVLAIKFDENEFIAQFLAYEDVQSTIQFVVHESENDAFSKLASVPETVISQIANTIQEGVYEDKITKWKRHIDCRAHKCKYGDHLSKVDLEEYHALRPRNGVISNLQHWEDYACLKRLEERSDLAHHKTVERLYNELFELLLSSKVSTYPLDFYCSFLAAHSLQLSNFAQKYNIIPSLQLRSFRVWNRRDRYTPKDARLSIAGLIYGFEFPAYLILRQDCGGNGQSIPLTAGYNGSLGPKICDRCPTHDPVRKLDDEEEGRFRKALLALNLDPGLVRKVKEYDVGCGCELDDDE